MRILVWTVPAIVTAAATPAEEFVVTMAGARYAPAEITAAVGDTIRLVNDDSVDHNVFVPTVGHAMDLGAQDPGTDRVFTLRRPGAFEIECVFHADMKLDVEVGG